MIISNIKIKGGIITFILLLSFTISAQKKTQTIGFVDMEYILLNISSYSQAQEKLNSEVDLWKKNLDEMYLNLKTAREEFLNEKALLTPDLIKERENDLKLQEQEILEVENTYFGSTGKLFQLRQQLVGPFQDMVYNAVQTIAKSRKFDMVFEKSTALTLLYTNNNYDISDTVLKYLKKSQKEIEKAESDIKRQEAKEARQKRIEDQKKKRAELSNKRATAKNGGATNKEEEPQESAKEALLEKIEAQKKKRAEKKKQRQELLQKRIEERKAKAEALKKEREDKKKALEQVKEEI